MFQSLKRYRARRHAPVTRLAGAQGDHAPIWPTVSIVFLLCAGVMFNPLIVTVANSMLLGLAVAVVLLGKRRVDPAVLHFSVPFGVICFFGLASGVGADRYDYFKDLWYVLNPALVVLTGYVLYKVNPDLGKGLRAFVIGGLIVGIFQMRGYFFDPGLILLPGAAIRARIGTGFYAPVLALGIILIYAGDWRKSLKMPTWLVVLSAVILTLSVVGVFSRAAVLVMGVFVASRFGCFDRREWLRVGLPLAVLIFIFFLLEAMIDTQSDQALLNFGAKLVRSVTEIAVSDYTAARDVAVNFRGYETQQVLNQFARSDVIEMLFGQGFGALVDLGYHLPLGLSETGGRYTRYIGVFHNGYMYLLTKVGAIGLLLFLYVLVYLYFLGRRQAALQPADPMRRVGRLMQGVALALAATTYIIAGVFNKFDMFPFLLFLGYLLAKMQGALDAAQADSSGMRQHRVAGPVVASEG